jgi:hypothetical protein
VVRGDDEALARAREQRGVWRARSPAARRACSRPRADSSASWLAWRSRARSVVKKTFASRTSWVASTWVMVTKPSRGSERSRATASAST